ncbi:MAG: LUD domain-containing protein [Ferruginibacter sp.]
MSSRNNILASIKKAKPAGINIEVPQVNAVVYEDPISRFKEVLAGIGGHCFEVKSYEAINRFIHDNWSTKRIISNVAELNSLPQLDHSVHAHQLENIEIAVLQAQFAVAENGAVWLTGQEMGIRVLPFISQQLAVVVNRAAVLSNMQQAYETIGNDHYAFAAFIAGPSKTADIEQSLVLGAHGPAEMAVFVMW